MKIAVVGTGAMALRFLDAVKDLVPGIEFTSAYDKQESQLNLFKEQHPSVKAYGDYEELLTEPGVDAVYISTPVNTHPELAIAAASHGKHILCEKPMAVSLSECESMVSAAEENRVVLQIGYMMRFQPYHKLVRQLIEDGELGQVRFLHVERTDRVDFKSGVIPKHRMWFVDRSISGGGAFMDLGCHLIDLLLYLLGDEPVGYSFAGTVDPDLGVELSGLASLKFSKASRRR